MPVTDTAAFTSNLFGSIQSDPFLSARRKNFLASDMLDQQEKIQEQQLKAQQVAQQLELNNVRLESDRLALEEARRAAQVKRDAIAQAPAAVQTFESILDDPTLDPKAKRARINRAAMNFSGALIYSPDLQAKYKFAAQAAEPEPAAEPALTPYQEFEVQRYRNEAKAKLAKDQKEEEDKRKEEADKRSKSELEFLDRIRDIEIGPENGIPGQPMKFKSPSDRELALDVLDKYDPATADAYIDNNKSDQEIYSAAAHIRRKILRQLSAPAGAPEKAPRVDDKSRFR